MSLHIVYRRLVMLTKVVVLDNGKIVQTGEFNGLAYDNGGLFNRLLQNQKVFQEVK